MASIAVGDTLTLGSKSGIGPYNSSGWSYTFRYKLKCNSYNSSSDTYNITLWFTIQSTESGLNYDYSSNGPVAYMYYKKTSDSSWSYFSKELLYLKGSAEQTQREETFNVSLNGVETLSMDFKFEYSSSTKYTPKSCSFSTVTVTFPPIARKPKIEVYNGSGWVSGTPWVYNGSSWVEAKEVYVYNGSSWVPTTHRGS